MSISFVDGLNVATFAPDVDLSIAGYSVQATSASGAAAAKTTTESSVAFPNLGPGSWTFDVTAVNAAGTAIGSGSAAANVSSGRSDATEITIVPISGRGAVDLSISWAGCEVTDPSVRAVLVPATGPSTELTPEVSGSGARFIVPSMPSGNQSIVLQLLDGGDFVAGTVDVLQVVKSMKTSANVDFCTVMRPPSGKQGKLRIKIKPALADPLEVSIRGVPAAFAAGASVTARASVQHEKRNLIYVWYLNGESKALGPRYSVGGGLDPGYYRLDVTAFTADGSRAGSATTSFQVTTGS